MPPQGIDTHVGGQAMEVSVEMTRTADTNAYTAGDVVSNATGGTTAMVFGALPAGGGQGAPRPADSVGGSGYITRAQLITDQIANVAQFRLYLFTKSQASLTLPGDNAPMTTLYVDHDNLIGYIDFPALAVEAGTATGAYAQVNDLRLPFVCAANDQRIYGVLVTKTAFTPASAQKFKVKLLFDQN
jgi:hypothetical protein